MLHRNGSRSKDVVEFRDVKEENRDEEREYDGRKQVPVERVLEQGEAARAQGEEIEPLPVGVHG